MSTDRLVRARRASRRVTAAAYAVPLCGLPSALWHPLLAVVTLDYWRRRVRS